jgi:nucleotide-binding universal stress UspA family protein
MSRIVVGIDGSESSKDALRWAKTQADLTGAELVAVTAWSYPVASYPTLAGYVPVNDSLDLEAESRTALETLVKETLGDVPVTLEVIEGHPANALVDAAHDAALVVLGSRGHGGFVGAVIGSVSQHVVSHAPCPVVVVRHPKPKPAKRMA